MIERVMCAVLDVFCSCYAVILAIRLCSAVLCKQFVNKRLTCVNNLSSVYHIVSLAIINRLFSMLKGLKQTIKDPLHYPAPLSMNEFTTVYWNSYTSLESL